MSAERSRLLIVDDEPNTRDVLVRFLKRRYQVDSAVDGSEAIGKIGENTFDLVLTDLRMPGADGMEVLRQAQQKGIKCIVLTAYGTIEDAVRAVKLGAFDFVPKPINLDALVSVIQAALSSKNRSGFPGTGNPGKTEKSGEPVNRMFVPPEGDPMRQVYDTAVAVSGSRASVLLTGESGTGKEVVARLIHERSQRIGKFVPVHCAALTSTILESELFGYEKGAFTGAQERRQGKFELADGGTVFLDEIGEIDSATQVKLLRVLETRSFERVGGIDTVRSDFRLVAATNRNLREMVANGTFREDLYYRLAVVNLELPPLRKRQMEIPELVNRFVEEFALENNRKIPKVSSGAMKRLLEYSWPGNIRELRNCIESVVVLLPGDVIEPEHIPEFAPVQSLHNGNLSGSGIESGSSAIRDVQWDLIASALERCNGNRTRAAEMLGISRRTIQRKISEHESGRQKN